MNVAAVLGYSTSRLSSPELIATISSPATIPAAAAGEPTTTELTMSRVGIPAASASSIAVGAPSMSVAENNNQAKSRLNVIPASSTAACARRDLCTNASFFSSGV